MKLAEALAERKTLANRFSTIEARLRNNARVQEGDAVREDPEKLFGLLEQTAEALRDLMVRIARTNQATLVEGRSMADWIAERDVALRRFSLLSGSPQGLRACRAPQCGRPPHRARHRHRRAQT